MTRVEEIQELIDKETGIDNYGSLDYQVGLFDGVRLADKTMIEKACEFIKGNLANRIYDRNCYLDTFVGLFIEDFRKAMEE